MNGTKVLPCTCKDEFQDATYGIGLRLHNLGGKGSKLAFCTVCSPSTRRLRLNGKTPVPAADRKGKTL